MADEEKNEQVEPEEEEQTQEEPQEETEEQPQRPQVDDEAINAIKAELEEVKKASATSAQANKKLEDIAKVIGGQKREGFDREKFLNDFAYNPEETLNKFYKERSSAELNEIKTELKQRKLADQDREAFNKLQNSDPDYNNVVSNMSKVMPREEFNSLYKSLEDNPQRTEIIYSTVKDRLNRQNASKKSVEENTNKKARQASNQTARSEVPSGGTVDSKSDVEEERERINKARENFDVDKVLDMVIDGDYTRLWNTRQNR